MTDPEKMPPFVPQEPPTEPMVVMTVRMPPKVRAAMKRLHRTEVDEFDSVSKIMQVAVEKFLIERGYAP